MLARRTMLAKLLGASAGLAFARNWNALAASDPVSHLKLSNTEPVEIPKDFIGLGYEMSSVATPGLLSPANDRYLNLVRGLGPQGVLRVGGIVANYTHFVPGGTAEHDRKNTVINHACLERLAAFLREVRWRAIWSVNFAQGTIAEAIEEARAVAGALGSNLLAIEIGNEVDTYGKGQPFRPASYDYEAYRKEYAEWHAAIEKAVPGIPFAAPDTARTGDWVEQMATDAKGEVQLLTTHYYRNGQSRGSAGQLLAPDPRLKEALVGLRTASQRSGFPWRMCEINSFSGGGLPGVSDTFVGALWTLNTMLLLAQYGCAGVNIETGVNQLGFVSSYSPIQDDGKGDNSAGVPYYGMLAFATVFAGCHQLLPFETGIESDSLHAYVLGNRDKPRSVVIVNMDATSNAQISFASLGRKHARVLRLLAPSPESKSAVTFGGASVDESGKWRSKTRERVNDGQVNVPYMSAVVLLLGDE
ncbi:MAG TPA: glycosyl hydrolase family 79 C-terminal domain-containing protein [Terracidiphilus sp.]